MPLRPTPDTSPIRWPILWLGATLAAAPGAGAQAVRVRAVEAETGRAVVGAIVVLLDSVSRSAARGLTNEGGRIVLAAPRNGTFRLRADRIGYPGVLTGPFVLIDTVSQIVTMPLGGTILPDLTVAGVTPCDVRKDRAETAGLWEEIRKSLTATQITLESESVVLAVTRFRRYRSPSGVAGRDSMIGRFTTRNAPFAAGDPQQLHLEGFIQKDEDRYRFFAPDAGLVLSSEFLEDHCFEASHAGTGPSELVGLAFRPVPARRLPDVRGTLWVDRRSAALRSLDFEYVNAPDAVRADGIGGRIELQRLDNGLWVVTEWYIRTANRIRLQPARRALRPWDLVVVGFIEEGGVAVPLGSGASLVDDLPPKTSVVTVAYGELQARVVSSEGRPVVGATVTVPGLDSNFTTGRDGEFRVEDLPEGPVVLRVAAIGYAPRALAFRISRDRLLTETTIVLKSVAQPLAPLEVIGHNTPVVAKLEEFERRRKFGIGTFLTRVELAKWESAPLSMALRTVRGLRMAPRLVKCGGGYAFSTGRSARYAPCLYGTGCPAAVYIDGVRLYDGDGEPPKVDDFLTARVEAIEVYRGGGEAPVEYNTTGSLCGVVLIWTRISSN